MPLIDETVSARPRAWRTGVALVALAALISPSHASAAKPDAKQACADAFTKTQRLRRDGKLLEARQEAKGCASQTCPGVVQRECERLVEELERAIPSVLLRVRDPSGRETLEVAITLDGAPFKPPPAGLAAELNPGSHAFEVSYGGSTPLRRDVVIFEGVKARTIDVSFEPPPAPAPVATAPAPPPPPPPEPRTPTLSYVLGGVGVVGVAGFVALGLSARSSFDDLEKSCGPSCPNDKVDPVRRRALFADVSLGVGLVSLGVATYLFVNSRRPSPKSASAATFDTLALPGGGLLTLRRSF